MSTAVRQTLEELRRGASGEYIFPGGSSGRLHRAGVTHGFKRACADAGIVGFRFHDLRHTFGTRLGDADVNLKKIARLMGHSNTKQTERYVHPTDEGLRAAVEVAKARPEKVGHNTVTGVLRQVG